MSTGGGGVNIGSVERARPIATHVRDRVVRFGRAIFGDRLGLTIFLGALCFFAVYWRVGVFINDTYTVANTLVAVADGHLFVEEIVYGPGPGTPGMHQVGDRLYGRNYGQVVLALPALWTLEGVAAVADLRVALAGAFSLLVLGTCVQAGHLADRRRALAVLGSVVALALFAGNVALATPIDPRWLPLIALQVSTMVAAGLVGVVVYRLLALVHGRRVGAVTGVIAVLATPVAFWASLPKRHVLTTLLALCTLYWLYRSRAATTANHRVWFRALGYVPVGLTAWVHAPEALVLLVALVVVDLPTARSNDPRTLVAVGSAFALSLVPFFLTNLLITGNPVEPPRLLPAYESGVVDSPVEPDTSGSGVLSRAVAPLTTLGSLFADGATVAVAQPDRLVATFLRSGYIESIATENSGRAINLTVLESAPVVGAVLALPAHLAVRRPDREEISTWLRSPAGATDALAITYALVLTLVYLPRLPLHAQVTVRYLLALFPILVYVIVRLPAVRHATRRTRTFTWTVVASTLVGGQVLIAGLALIGVTRGEAMQVHAWIGLVTALILGGWTVVATVRDRPGSRVGAVCLGVATGAGIVFALFSGVIYFAYAGDFALPISRLVSEVLAGAVE